MSGFEDVSVPTLVVVGERDLDFYNVPIAQTLAKRIPGARKVRIPGVGHMSNMEDPAWFNEVVLGFIEEVDSAFGGPGS